MKTSGVVKWYNETKGFGFINECGEGVQDIFVHYSSIKGNELPTDDKGNFTGVNGITYKSENKLTEGQHVTFELITGPKGPQAMEVEVKQ